MRQLTASLGSPKHNARVIETWHGTWKEFVAMLLKDVPETLDKASAGWISGAEFDPPYRDSENFVARHLLSFDYDHITSGDVESIFAALGDLAYFAYTTWSHVSSSPRIRIWMPLFRACGYDEFQAVSRAVAARAGIERAARESHVPAQYMFFPTIKPFEAFEHWENTEGPWIDVDEVLKEYGDDWTDRSSWPRRTSGDGVLAPGSSTDPRTKPGIVGGFCRAFGISAAIEKFGLPYAPSGTEGRYTYTQGSRPEGCIIYDSDTKLHSHHDTDAARGQHNAYDLVRLHRFHGRDSGCDGVPLSGLPSSREMARFAAGLPEVQAELMCPESEFQSLGELGSEVHHLEKSLGELLPPKIPQPEDHYTDLANCCRIQNRFGSKIISVGQSFYVWDGTHWKGDDSEARRTYIAQLPGILEWEKERLLEKFQEAAKDREPPVLNDIEEKTIAKCANWASRCGSRATREACALDLANFLKFDAERLNLQANYLTCLNGTIDLKTQELMPHNPVHFITGCAPTNYDPEAEAPRFVQFLHEIFDDREIVDFVQRWLGYSITGSIEAQTVVFHVGQGGNGKGKLMEMLANILGHDYYGTHDKNLLAKQPGAGAANPSMADLLGKRMVTIPETPRMFEVEDDVIKYLTGGDAITTRQLHKSNFTFRPTHKLQIFTNYRPIIHGQDHAMWRRIVLLPYRWRYGSEHDIATGKAERLADQHLSEKLAKEREGVFAWLVEGARAWYENPKGLDVPASLRAATDQYRREEDIVGRFVENRVVTGNGAKAPLVGEVGSVFTAYRGWCEEMGHRSFALPRFTRELLRVVGNAREDKWLEGSRTIHGIVGLKLTDDALTR